MLPNGGAPVSVGGRGIEGFLTAEEVGRALHLHVKRVQALARGGKLPAVRVGRKWLFSERDLRSMLRAPASRPSPTEEDADMEISARNQLRGRVTAISLGGVMAEVRLEVGGQELVAVITRASVERLKIKVGAEVVAIIKATEVMIGTS